MNRWLALLLPRPAVPDGRAPAAAQTGGTFMGVVLDDQGAGPAWRHGHVHQPGNRIDAH